MIRRIFQGGDEDLALLQRFLDSAGSSLTTFRYFARRPLEVVRSHLHTEMLLDASGAPVAYGHLDPEGAKVWLGICVAESMRGRGMGRRVIESLITEATARGRPSLWLKVDAGNEAAIALYRKMGFEVREEEPSLYLIMERP